MVGKQFEMEQPAQAPQAIPRSGLSRQPTAPPLLVRARYLLITSIHCVRDRTGRRWINALWHRDLLQHLRYLPSFTLACPVRFMEPEKDDVCISDDAAYGLVKFVELPHTASLISALLGMPKTIARLWGAVGRSDIVHMGIAGWPIPLGLLAMPIARVRRRKTVVNVESSPWRTGPNAPLRARLRGAMNERFGRWCVNCADLPLFTQRSYQQELLTRHREKGHVVHASWLEDAQILSDEAATALWTRRLHPPGKFRAIVAGRLIAEKGILVLLDAMRELSRRGVEMTLDILGSGPLLETCEKAAVELTGSARLRLLDSVPYGPELFRLLDNYQALVAPLISDEQPRIVYDAFARALPVIGTTAAGMADCVMDGKTGRLCPPNDAKALADLLQWAGDQIKALPPLGGNALLVARGLTHQEMHRKRSVWLNEMDLPGRNSP